LTASGARYATCAPPVWRTPSRPPVEIADADKPPLIRLYLRKWAWETGAFFDGLKADSPEADIAAAAPGFPVFRIVRN
jgi:hypothetical protein